MVRVVSTNHFGVADDPVDLLIHSEIRDWARDLGIDFGAAMLPSSDTADQVAAMRGCDAVIIGTEPFTADVIEQLAEHLKVVVRFGVGYDSVDLEAASRHGVLVANTPGANNISVAEHALALMLALLKNLGKHHVNLRSNEWLELLGTDLTGKTVGLIGFGAVAQALALLLGGFSCRLLAYDPYLNTDAAERLGVVRSTVEEIAAVADVVSLHVPLTKETRHLVNDSFLEQMRPHALLVNTSRGGVIDEAALLRSLRNKQIGGVGLDVFQQEPLGSDSGFLEFPNVVVTPHVAASTSETVHGTYRMALNIIRDIIEGRPCKHVLNR